jgi:predicted DNA-binding transcriptional regulator YafY
MARTIDQEIHGLLATGEHYTAVQLARNLSVSLRTVRRAIARLRETDVVIESDVGRGGGIRLGRKSTLPRLHLQKTEVISLLLSLALAESLKLPLLGRQLPPLRNKLNLAFDSQDRHAISGLRRRILIGDVASAEVQETWSTPRKVDVDALQIAFFSRNSIRFNYTDVAGILTDRLVEPQYLILCQPVWYLVAFDSEKKLGRTFRIDRISQVKTIEVSMKFNIRPIASLLKDAEQWFSSI